MERRDDQTRRRDNAAADAQHLGELLEGLTENLHAWRHRRRLTQHAQATLLVVLLPASLFVALPQRVADSRVLCNQRGGEDIVVARACEGLSLGDRCRVCNRPDGGGIFQLKVEKS